MTATRLRDNAESLRKKTMIVLRIAFLSSAVLELFAAIGVAMVAVYIGFHLLGTLDFGAWGHKLTLAEGLFILLLAPAFLSLCVISRAFGMIAPQAKQLSMRWKIWPPMKCLFWALFSPQINRKPNLR